MRQTSSLIFFHRFDRFEINTRAILREFDTLSKQLHNNTLYCLYSELGFEICIPYLMSALLTLQVVLAKGCGANASHLRLWAKQSLFK